jgi:hypothetical protein
MERRMKNALVIRVLMTMANNSGKTPPALLHHPEPGSRHAAVPA